MTKRNYVPLAHKTRPTTPPPPPSDADCTMSDTSHPATADGLHPEYLKAITAAYRTALRTLGADPDSIARQAIADLDGSPTLETARQIVRKPGATVTEIARAASVLAHSHRPDDRTIGRAILDNSQT